MSDKDMVSISFETAEYLSILVGQNVWGNEKRRGKAANELAKAMGARPMTNSLECFGRPSHSKKP